MALEKSKGKILEYLYSRDSEIYGIQIKGNIISAATNLTAEQVNDAVELLENSGLVESFEAYGTMPYKFHAVRITASGKDEVQKRRSLKEATRTSRPQSKSNEDENKRDLFICHATEDKEIVRPLVEALVNEGFSVWYDEFALKLGDRLRRSIETGLSQSRYGLVVISPNFFRKEWTQKELDGLAAKEHNGKQVILPVWHNVDAEYVRKKAPMLSGIFAVSTTKGIDHIVKEVQKAIRPSRPPQRPKRTIKESIRSELKRKVLFLRSVSGTVILSQIRDMEFAQLKKMFQDVLDAVAFFELQVINENIPIFNFILNAILERNRTESAELFEMLLDWYFGTVTSYCKYIILKMFADLTKLSHLKRVIAKKNRSSFFVAEFGQSFSYDIAGINAEILQNVKSLLTKVDCRNIVDFALTNVQISGSYSAQPYLVKLLPTCQGKVDPRRIEELHQMLQ